MAVVRCQDHPPQNTNYELAVKPVGYPDTALICGREDGEHTESGWVFLRSQEYDEYQSGKRVKIRLYKADIDLTDDQRDELTTRIIKLAREHYGE